MLAAHGGSDGPGVSALVRVGKMEAMTARAIRLTSDDLSYLERPVTGEGGFQSLLRHLKASVAGTNLVVDDETIEQMRRYAGKYGSGGFQARLREMLDSIAPGEGRTPEIRRLVVSNYRSLGQDTTIRLGRLTAFVGPNGSGKSNTVDILRFLSDAMHIGLEGAITRRHGIGAVRRWSSGHPFNVSISADVSGPAFQGNYGFTLAGASAEDYSVKEEHASLHLSNGTRHEFKIERGTWVDGPNDLRPSVDPLNLALPLIAGDERFKPLADVFRRIAIYAIFPDTLREPQKYDPAKPMDRHGSNWVSVLKDQPRQTWEPDLLAALGKLTGDIDGIKITPVGGYFIINFRHKREDKESGSPGRHKWFDAAQESDGTLRFAGIVSALLQQPHLPVIGIEEPELTIHAGAIPLLFDLLQETRRRSQVVLTTHSPELLDLLSADDVRVVERVAGVTTVSSMGDAQRDAVKQGLMTLGEMVRTGALRQGALFTPDGDQA